MSRRDAALRGAGTAALWAVIAVAILVGIGDEGIPAAKPVEAVADIVRDMMATSGVLAFAAAAVVLGAAAGAALGLVSRRLRIRPPLRAAVLAVASIPTLWLVIAATWLLVYLPIAAVEKPSALAWAPVGALWFSGIAVAFAAPVLVVPAVLAAVLLEGWTRPEDLAQTGLAAPALRRRVLLVLVAAATALTTFAVLTWLRR